MSGPLHLAIVMPPVATGEHDAVLDGWTTVTAMAAALARRGDVVPTVHARHATRPAAVRRDEVIYRFHTSDAALVSAVQADRPDAVHVHGLGWARLLRRLRRVSAPLVLQHHGEPVFTGRAKWGHHLVRSHVAAYLFTGADHGQARPWVDAGVIAREARVIDVLEAASLLSDQDGPEVHLAGEPAVLWVGRLVPGKDPLTAVNAFGMLVDRLPGAHLHLLATDRQLEPMVRAAITALGDAGGRVHLHDPVPHAAMGAWFAAADVFLSTSHHEGSGYSVIESLSRGCPPAVTSIPPHRSIVGDIGATFAVGDPADAARAIERAAATPRVAALERSRNVLSWERLADRLAEVYHSLR